MSSLDLFEDFLGMLFLKGLGSAIPVAGLAEEVGSLIEK